MVGMKGVYLGELRVDCFHPESGSKITTDAPKDNGGLGQGFSPTDLVAAALGSCMLTLMGLAAKKLGVDLRGTTVETEKVMVQSPHRMIGEIIVAIRCPRSFPQAIQEKLEKAAIECPVHFSLHSDIKQKIEFVWGV